MDRELPPTRLAIGMRVNPKPLLAGWGRERLLRRAIQHMRETRERAERQGRAAYPSRRLTDRQKATIRQQMRLIDSAEEAQVCGITTDRQGSIFNQCYIGGVHGAASGLYYYAILLFRGQVTEENGRVNQVAFIPGDQRYLFPENAVLRSLLTGEEESHV